MKKFLACLLVLCLAFVPFIFAGCEAVNSITLEGGPASEDEIFGNGGFVVKKGDYIYYASGFVQTSDLGTGGLTNNLGDVENGALYRAKVEYQTEGTQGEEGFSQKMVINNSELLLSKLVGFNNSGLYIFGDKIYFGTPATTKDNSGNVEYSMITFYSMDLNGQNLKSFYQTTEFNGGDYSFVKIDNNIYLILNTGLNLLRIDLTGKVVTLASEIQSAVIANDTVFYTLKNEKSTDKVDLGTELFAKDIKSLEETKLFNEDYLTIKLIKYENDVLYYNRNVLLSAKSPSSESYLYANTLENDFFDGEIKLLNHSEITNFVETINGLVYINNSKLYIKNMEVKQLSSSASSILCADGDYVYYINSSAIYRVDVTASNPTGVKLSGSNTINSSYFDIDENFVYFFVKNSTTNNYETYSLDIKYLNESSITPTKIN